MGIPKDLFEKIINDPYYKICCRKVDGGCSGRITFEHAVIFKGKQLNKLWSIIPLCEAHHSIGNFIGANGMLDKEINLHIALQRATEADLLEISKIVDYNNLKSLLFNKYKKRYDNNRRP